ncbi:MAG: hypothetical protein M1586_00820 [Patescibacteria group bacterium]|nr:hypothetical protein [Patescibacteria group bacterium]MCL5261828.1 hypothetical protein [Patescibacteria group bacterium]
MIVKRRIAIKGHRCEDCGATNVKLIGHHVLPFSALKDVRALRASRGQDGIDLIEFCRLRCPTCETQAHKNPAYVWGNPPEEQERVIAYLEESGYQIRQWRYRRQFDRTALAPAGEMME